MVMQMELLQLGDKNGAWLSDLGLSGYLGGDFDMSGMGASLLIKMYNG